MASTLFTAAIILGALIIFIGLFIILHKKGHNRKMAKQKIVFADLVWKNKLEISERESINDYLLAIDKINFVLLYINFSDPKEEILLIDLGNVKSVKVVSDDNSIYKQKIGKAILVDKQVIKLQLEVTFINNQSNAQLLLYQYKDGAQHLLQIKRRANY